MIKKQIIFIFILGFNLTIKPYLPSIDGVKSAKNESIEKELGLHGANNNDRPPIKKYPE